MKNKLFFAGLLITILTIIFVVAGCDNTTGGGGGPTPTPAEQLATDLNKIEAGSATVDGATVKIASDKFVWLQNDLTVPAGVTLDVTANDAALGLGDVTLTVNGVVNAGSNQVRFEDSASDVTINGSGTIYLKSQGELFSIEGNHNEADHKLTLDGVTLVGLEDNSDALVGVRSGGAGRTGMFVMKNGKITGNTHNNDSGVTGGGVKLQEGGGSLFIMEGGEISGNTVKSITADASGGGVAVENGATFTMSGGTISGNTSIGMGGSNGGGVKVNGGGVFTLKGGRIQGNTDSDGFTKNTGFNAAISVDSGGVKWGTGGTYTKGGVAQTGGSDIVDSDDTLIAIPAP
ncbi:hypothetical protein AGMMS49940_08400 [Spirochaetia bacterium]|nr:hypothetical protein AGMMS49940_08400 [Spirochaetia bacterium]